MKRKREIAPSSEGANIIRIYKVLPAYLNPINNISSHLGVTTNKFLRDKAKAIVDSYPTELKEKKQPCDPCEMETIWELTIRGVSEKTKNELETIAENLGVYPKKLLEIKIAECAASYPAYMRNTRKEK